MTLRDKNGLRGAAVAILTIVPLILAAQMFIRPVSGTPPRFTGTDDQASAAVQALAPSYTPWFAPLYAPRNGAEAVLFALQAALGAGFIGYYIGYSRGRKDKTASRASCENTAERTP